MVFTTLIASILCSHAEIIQGIVSQKAIILQIRDTWRSKLDGNDPQPDSSFVISEKNGLRFFTSSSDRAVFWMSSGLLLQYSTSRKTQEYLSNGAEISDVELKDAVRLVARAAGWANEVCIRSAKSHSYRVSQSWHGFPFHSPSMQISLDKCGNVRNMEYLEGDRLPSEPTADSPPDLRVNLDSAVNAACNTLLEKYAFEQFEILDSALGYFYIDNSRVDKLPSRLETIIRKDGSRTFPVGLVPGINYSPQTAVCYKIWLRTGLPSSVGSGAKVLDWWMYIDAVTGRAINVEMASDLLQIGAITNFTSSDSIKGKNEVFFGSKWIDAFPHPDIEFGGFNRHVLVRNRRFIYAGQSGPKNVVRLKSDGKTIFLVYRT